MRVVSVLNSKGGVGKTTLTANIGVGLAQLGYKVLLLDFDPQTNLTFSFYSPDEWDTELRPTRTIKRWFDAQLTDLAAVPRLTDLTANPTRIADRLRGSSGRLDLVSSHIGLTDMDLRLSRKMHSDTSTRGWAHKLRLHRMLADALEDDDVVDYDFVLIDCAPDFGIVTRIAVVASDCLLVPAKADHLSILGIGSLLGNIRDLADDYRSFGSTVRPINPRVLGVTFTMVQVYAGKPITSQQAVIKTLSKAVNVPIFDTFVRNSPKVISSAVQAGTPAILLESDESEISADLSALTNEFIHRVGSE
jgi:chromosome partitioning protein